jgi:hypothetical protein
MLRIKTRSIVIHQKYKMPTERNLNLLYNTLIRVSIDFLDPSLALAQLLRKLAPISSCRSTYRTLSGFNDRRSIPRSILDLPGVILTRPGHGFVQCTVQLAYRGSA